MPAIVRRPSSDRVTTANARRSGGDASDHEEAKQRRSCSDARDAGSDRPSTVCDGPPWVPGRRRQDVCAHARERTRHVYAMTM